MNEHSSKEPVSHSHIHTSLKKNDHASSLDVHTATLKKNQLQAALGDFNREKHNHIYNKKSLLSDEGNVLHVGKEKQGTIIKDTKHKRWSFTDAMKNSLGGWLTNKKDTVTQTFKKPIPKKTIETSSTRTETIKKITHLSTVADNQSFKKVVQKPQITRRLRSSIRIKPKDVAKEIGDTKPRWTHIIEDEENAIAQPPEPIVIEPTPKIESEKLIEAPDTTLLLPEHTRVVKPESIKKVYRSPRITHSIISSTPTEITSTTPTISNNPSTTDIDDLKPTQTIIQEPKYAKDLPIDIKPVADIEIPTSSNGNEVTPKLQRIQNNFLEGTSSVTVSTLVMIIVFIAIVGTSTMVWNTIETEDSTANVVRETSEITETNKTTVTTISELLNTIHINVGFTKFVSTTTDDFMLQAASWNEFLERGILGVVFGAFDSRPFIVIQTDSKETAIASMLSVESNIPPMLIRLFALTNTGYFSQGTLAGKNIRILKEDTLSKLVYFVRGDGTIFIASTTDDLMALIDHTK